MVCDPAGMTRVPLRRGTGRSALNGPAPMICATEGFREVLQCFRPGKADCGPVEMTDTIEPVTSGVSAAAMRAARAIHPCPNP